MQQNDQVADSSEYGAEYYASHCGEAYERSDLWLNQFGLVADRIVSALQPRSALDVGCAHGFLVEALAKRGVAASGIDFSEYAISQVHESVADTCTVASATEPIDERFDLIISVEMLEHLTPGDALLAIANMTAATDTLLISTTPNDFTEPTHINVQQPEYWAGLFAEQGFIHDLTFDGSFLTPWTALYRRSTKTVAQVVHEYERELYLARLERADLRSETKRLWSVIDASSQGESSSLGEQNVRQREQNEALAGQIDALTQELWSARDALEGALAARGSAQGQLAVALGEVAALRLEHEEWEATLYVVYQELAAAKQQLASPSFQLEKSRALASKAKRKLGQ